MYELRKQMVMHKTVEECDMEEQKRPRELEIDQLKVKEGELLAQINEQSQLFKSLSEKAVQGAIVSEDDDEY